jgi:tetratricopeptide (TPR) repeat protein
VDPTIIDRLAAETTEPYAVEPRAWSVANGQVVVGDIPAQRPGFQPRPALLAIVNRTQEPPVVVLTGGEGVGKTQLAAAYARARQAGGWRMIAWVNAHDTKSLLTGLAAAAEATIRPDGGAQENAADAAQALRRWLEADGSRCLLVLDDAQDRDLLRPFLPAAGIARVLITGARGPVAELGTSVPVDVFSPEEAVALLAGRTGLSDQDGASAVAAELGYLPLALDQAAAVITGQHLGYPEYLARVRTLPVEDFLIRQENGNEEPYPKGVAAAVLLNLEAARAADPVGVCAALMQIVAMLSPAAVGRELLRACGQAGTLLGGGRKVAASMVDQALERLNTRSLVGFSLDRQAVSVHCLVARVVRDELARRGGLAAARQAAADALHQLIELGGNVPHAIATGGPLVADLERVLGPDHPDTLSARSSLAEAYHAAGRIADAIPPLRQILAARERLLGADQPSTLAARNNLASAYRATGRPAEAIPLFEQNVAACERLLGAHHPKTSASRYNLDLARQEAALVDQVGGDFQGDGA